MKTTMKYHLTPIRMAIINKSTYKCWLGCGKKSMELSQKIKNGTALCPRDSTSGNLSEETWNTNLKEHKYPCAHCSTINNSQDLEAAQVSLSRRVDKTTMVHYPMDYYSATTKENITLCNSMDGPGEHYAMWNKSVRERQIPCDFTHMWNLVTKLN